MAQKYGSDLNPPSSSPCSMHEADSAYMGYLSRDETVALLTQLLEGERAGAKVALHMLKEAQHEDRRPHVGAALNRVRLDEAHCVNMLAHHLERFGMTPSALTGAFREKVLAEPDLSAQVDLLNRGQAWVVKKLREVLPRIEDPTLHQDLQQMLTMHEDNIAVCEHLI
ncbi:DUF6306 domain-containing protein [Govanella unica]|uniref:DUF6306 domain-containing protein n=1 Tax=Govanella unica TaxID=2975056 RepID=A0A9X3TYB7_9PROT|nr:DUF6306 domain-containing protein [Govania unica]MDA5194226.1 DUF6306 domain-containing protein [Govania unica]